MGSPDVGLHEVDERWHQVEISRPYWIGEREVTRRQYRAVIGALPKRLAAEPESDEDLPVTFVTWKEAGEFCRKLGDRDDGWHYRLPTEAEWEVACRANTPGEWAGRNLPDEMGWHAGNAGGVLHRGGGKTPNHWGLYDMHGNAGEWCFDAYGRSYPLSPLNPVVEEGTFRVVRGGAFDRPALACRSAVRDQLAQDRSRRSVGFRVAADGPPTTARATTGPATRPAPVE
jgi:formylglycine-generating enzyme required for sulfatase activity